MHEIETVKQLFVVIASSVLWETTTQGNEVEEFTTTNELEHDELDGLGSLLGVSLLTFVNFVKSNNVLVLELGESVNLSVDQFLEGLVRVDDLDGIASVGAILSKLDFARDAASERSSESVLVQSSWHCIWVFFSQRFLLFNKLEIKAQFIALFCS